LPDSTTCGYTFTRLRAEATGSGTGYWYTNNSATNFGNEFSNSTWATVPYYGYHNFYWIVENGPAYEPGFCTDTAGPLRIHFIQTPNANAGEDNTLFCGNTGNLNAIPSVGTGVWSTPSVTNVNFADINDPNTQITSNILNTENPSNPYFNFIWSEDNTGGCTDSDTIKVIFARSPNSGINIIPPKCSGEPATIAAIEDSLQQYSWNFYNGGIIDNTSTNALGGEYENFVHWSNTDTLHRINLIATNYWGCQSTTVDTVYEPPIPAFNMEVVSDTCMLETGSIVFGDTLSNSSFFWLDNVYGPPAGSPITAVYNLPTGQYNIRTSYQTPNMMHYAYYLNTFGSANCVDTILIDIGFSGMTYLFQDSHTMCAGETYSWQGIDYTVGGTYYDNYTTVNGCDSTYVLELTVNPMPQQIVVLKNPSNGVLIPGNSGQVSLSTSVADTKYWVNMGGALFTSEISGTGSGLNLGNNFPSGSFDVWSKNQYECQFLQGIVNFTENTGTNKIVANVTFGTPASNFPANHAKVVLYKKAVDISNNEVIVFEAEQMLGINGQAEFNNLLPGEYYLGSFLQFPDNYNVAPHIYYQTAVVHEDAISIPVVDGTVFIASLHHVMLEVINGTNNGSGIVGTEGGKNSLNLLEDMVVILRSMDASEIIDVSVTDINGRYEFENIPENTNIQIFVTSFAHQNWIPFTTHTGTNQNYNINFIVDGNSVYPEGTTDIFSFELSKIDFNIYPNPAKDVLSIKSCVENGVIKIYDTSGKLAQTGIVFGNSEINISNLSPGTYIIIITNENGETGVQKFVKE
ncbi:MAG: T9SS type A sorting domain-containing protein, partial [Bacteroidales bacterium]|nr:T9SS type A sorting domain-containing protein [Bacteroidales bacterium]